MNPRFREAADQFARFGSTDTRSVFDMPIHEPSVAAYCSTEIDGSSEPSVSWSSLP